jgi:hypothetical protein
LQNWSRGLGAALTFNCLLGMLVTCGAAQAKTVSVKVDGATQEWMTQTAASAAEATCQKLGLEMAQPGSTPDVEVTVAIENAYSHHATLYPLWVNRDYGHASVTTVVREGGREIAHQSGEATRAEFPLFCIFWPARTTRTAALRAAVNASLKGYSAGLSPASRSAVRP